MPFVFLFINIFERTRKEGWIDIPPPCPGGLSCFSMSREAGACSPRFCQLGQGGGAGGWGGEGTFLCFSFSLLLPQIPLTKDRPRIEFILGEVLWETEVLPLCF